MLDPLHLGTYFGKVRTNTYECMYACVQGRRSSMLDKCRHCVQYVEGGVHFSCIMRTRTYVCTWM